jgi:CRISPR-associated protein Csd2
LLFDVTDGNPNGDPDAGNLPRADPETMHGIVTDVCLKRKVRDYVSLLQGPEVIYVKHRGILANEQKKAYTSLGIPPQDTANESARQWMCRSYYDIRLFGAVMTTGKAPVEGSKKDAKWNCGQVRGPVQMTFARSVDPITPLDLSITRVALTNAGDTRKEDADEEVAGSGQMGRKPFLPYGLYVGHGFYSAPLAEQTGVSAQDLALFWDALHLMWDQDHSASRGLMACRGLYVFTHGDRLGRAPSHELFERILPVRKLSVESPRSFRDYDVAVEDSRLPEGVTLTRLVG